MKTKLLCTILVSAMTMTMLSACGGNETTAEPVEEAVVEETVVEETTEPQVAEEVVEEVEEEKSTNLGNNQDEMKEEPEVTEEEFNQDVAMKKVERSIDCYRKLLATEDEATWNIIDALECLGQWQKPLDLTTSDGQYIYNNDDSHSITIAPICAMGTVYYEYVNGIINEVIPMSDYINYRTYDEIADKYNFREAAQSTNSDIPMFYTAIVVMNYLNQAETIEAGDFITLDEPPFICNGSFEPVYKIPLIVNGENSRLWAAFDKNGMMIQIGTEEDVDVNKVIVYTFPEH